MSKTGIMVLVATAVLIVGVVGGFVQHARADTSPAPAVPSATSATVNTTEAAEPDAGLPDTDNVQVQEGDQNGPDDKAEKAEADADGPGGPNDQSGNQVEDGLPDAGGEK